MGSTFSSLRIHIVFSTKLRKPSLHSSWRSELHKYLGGTTRGLGAIAEAVGGVADHVHLLVSYRPTLTISDFVRELKKASSTWIAQNHVPDFAWQEGYSVFSVSVSQKPKVRRYIANQETHHAGWSFTSELITLLRYHEIEFDPKYLD